MSKAFARKDGDDAREELLPDRIALPHRNLVTANGLARIAATIEALQAARRASLASADVLTGESVARDLRYWVKQHETAELVETTIGTRVTFGARVTITRGSGSHRTYRIVGFDEADPKTGTLSYASPLAQSLLGKNVGDAVQIGGQEEEITAIS